MQAEAPYPDNLASPLQIIIDASNGASDYGNKFGEPIVNGWVHLTWIPTTTTKSLGNQ